MLPYFNNLFKKRAPKFTLPILMAAAFMIWVFLFRKSIFNDSKYIIDAIAYHDHFRTFITNIVKGVYPLWDPFMDLGNLNEFSLRRIGEFNPLYIILMALSAFISPFNLAYHIFLTVYFFIGCIGFYALAQKLFRNHTVSFTCFLLLYFSTLGMRIFYDFIILVFTPLMWFFYFFISFLIKPSRSNLLGTAIFTSVLLSTYVPFYYIVILLIFISLGIVCFAGSLKERVLTIIRFCGGNKLLVILSALMIFTSLIPGYLFLKAGRSNEFVMTQRSSSVTDTENEISAGDENSLKVKYYSLGEQGIIIPILAEGLFADPRSIKVSQFYVPFFALVLFGMGAAALLSRRMILTGLWFFIILLICQNDATPIGPFLYEHVFFFRYFRNVYLFLWLAIAPLFVFFISDLFLGLLKRFNADNSESEPFKRFLIYSFHGSLLLYLIFTGHAAFSSYLSLLLSLLFFELLLKKIITPNSNAAFLLLFSIITLQPLQGYSKSPLMQKIEANNVSSVIPDKSGLAFSFRQDYSFRNYSYLLNIWMSKLYEANDPVLLDRYIKHKIILFDTVVKSSEDKITINKVVSDLAKPAPYAFVPQEYEGPLTNGNPKPETVAIDENDTRVSVLEYTYNKLKLRTDLKRPKFLVYNESYHPGWKAFINGERTELVRANVAFKGIWVPEGINTVEFRFGESYRYWLGWGLIGIIYSSFFLMIYLSFKDHLNNGKDTDETDS